MKQILYIIFILICISTNSYSKETGKTITILHTNDTHSQLEPTSKGKGGIVNRAVLIDSIRQADPTVFVFDSGDFLQGSPYFNLFKGATEVKLMNEIGIDAGTIGNHEFDNGTEALFNLLQQMTYPIICTNLLVNETHPNNPIRPYTIIERNGVKVGVIGLLVNPQGLISSKNFVGLEYLNPFKEGEKIAKMLKKREKCDLVICLSHLGYAYPLGKEKYSDIELARTTRYIDVILGGHTHTLLKEPETFKGKGNRNIVINQVGYRGENLGIVKIKLLKTQYVSIISTQYNIPASAAMGMYTP